MSAAREEILARVRAALADRPSVSSPKHAYPSAATGDLAAWFAERASEYTARVHRCEHADVATVLAEILVRHDARRVAVPGDLPLVWRPSGVDIVDDPATAAELDGLDGVITGSALAIAETGTIALDAGVGQGRRALTLVPDLHVCIVEVERIVGTVPEGVELLRRSVVERRAPLTLISGPSATSDIELSRVEGVHGPRRLEIVIVG
ncbi:MAG: L-lactate dehydrogenase complex protein LldG [Gaiellales bacterium]|nr:L-lactate dehydrogenase complex protein LldG [Gaiellales bacterium]